MRRKRDTQDWLDFQASNLKLTNDYFRRYEAMSELLDASPKLLELVHRDLCKALDSENRRRRKKGTFRITSEMVLRLAVCQIIEGSSLREIIVRVDDSHNLRRFTRIHDGPMMNHTALCKLRNAIKPQTWKKLNQTLAEAAVESGQITPDMLRLDTTAVETNIHWPTDSSLLNDAYRTLGRLIGQAREIDSQAVGSRRVHLDRTRKLAARVARKAQAKGRKGADLKPLYKRLIAAVNGICEWSAEVVAGLEQGLRSNRYGFMDHMIVQGLVEELGSFGELSKHVIWQTSERALKDSPVANKDKLFSIFEPHTELLKRGKAGKDVEFGHMIQIQQTAEKFIADYDVFEKKPSEPTLIGPALKSHERLFGQLPTSVTTDKGYWSAEEYDELATLVEVASIPKKGRRNELEQEREQDVRFRLAQKFRAGIEGSISFLKRCFRLARCMNKGWKHYVSTVGATVFAHNLLVLARC